ncbi:GNAT family N-acetyltransferase [Thermoleptolyngbya sp. C42_A2020_037]|uniref:GNAT family N-acetyltransferase n=1 Tax=Thermoleptolyngbya sp. C42_A2020_037 TaxID=2747799 RepID=UPI0019E47461|nr:GNAT family N-acetyltransferase [Thermoleptolyngbya sp. C42_A2020_037]MBF2083556.1 GNAT family N-acetyltransferase [Thermoleptolyngbya sp. C42_A2020_037]
MSSSILFREILPEDIQAIFDVRIATWHNDRGCEELTQLGITHESVRDLLKNSHRGWLCEIDSRIIGFAMGNKSKGEMWVIAVLKEFEGKGIGKRLLSLVEEWLFSEGWKEIWLTTDPDESTRAVGFYRHLGWKDWKIEPDEGRFMKKVVEQPYQLNDVEIRSPKPL